LGYNKIKMEGTMEKVTKEAKRIWNLAVSNKKATIVVIVAIIIIVHLVTN
jgi:hypothetical protein